jgi:hypothetical protein
MQRIFFFALSLICTFTSLFSSEIYEKKGFFSNGLRELSMTIESPETGQTVVVHDYSLKNLSDHVIRHVFLTVNTDRENQKKILSQDLVDKKNLWTWWKLQQAAVEENGAYSSLVGSALHIPTRNVPAHGLNLHEYFFDNHWHLIDNRQNLVYVALDNHTIAGYEDVADDPFLALRTKTTGLENSYSFEKASSDFAFLDLFPKEFNGLEPNDEELQLHWNDRNFALYPREDLIFSADGTLTQTIVLKERTSTPGMITFASGYPIKSLINNSPAAITLEDQNLLLEPGETYDFTDPSYSVKVNIVDPSGELLAITQAPQASSWKIGTNLLDIGAEEIQGKIELTLHYTLESSQKTESFVSITNKNHYFDHETPYFELISKSQTPEKIWWQISSDQNFEFLIPNFQAIQEFRTVVNLDNCTNTFFNPREVYYARVKALQKGQWSEWSPVFEFSVNKPLQIKDPVFKKIGEKQYQISWVPQDADTHYYIFASNAFDFMPSIYLEENDQKPNLVAVTDEGSLKVGTDYAFYRIVAEKQGQYSVPSPIVHVYDYGLNIPRSVKQAILTAHNTYQVETIPFPEAYPDLVQDDVYKLRSWPLSLEDLLKEYYTMHAQVEPVVWLYLRPFFLPNNHPIKNKLDRLFSTRVTQNTETLRKAGFTKPTPMKFSKTIVTRNKNIPGYMFKFFSDDQKGLSDWQNCFNRVSGSIYIQEALNRYNINHLFVVPTKWIYPLPGDPSPPGHLERKNFIVVETELDIYESKENNKMWKSPVINRNNLIWVYQLLQELGLSDSPYSFNMPITKDNRIAFVDTEHHHEWPVPLFKLSAFLKSDMAAYWKQLCEKGYQ